MKESEKNNVSNYFGLKVLRVLAWICLILSFAILFILHGVTFFGLSVYSVNQNNMEPAISNGSAVVTKKVENGDCKNDDVVVFYSTMDTGLVENNDQMVERVVGVDTNTMTVTTKSDNPESPRGQVQNSSPTNTSETTAISFLEGKVIFSVPLLGYIYWIIGTIPGMICMFLIFALLVFLILLPTKYKAPKLSKSKDTYGDTQTLRGTKMKKE